MVLFSGDVAGVADPMMRERREMGREREGERVCVCWWKKKENENDPMQHDLPITINILNIIYQFLGLKT